MSGQCHHQQLWQQQHLSPAHLSTTIVWEELVSALRPEIWGFQGILILSHNSLLLRSHFDRCGTKSFFLTQCFIFTAWQIQISKSSPESRICLWPKAENITNAKADRTKEVVDGSASQKKWLFLEDKSLDTDQLSSTIHVTESQIILAKKELWRWSFTSWSVWRGFGWSFQSHPDHRQGWQGRWGEGCQQEEPTSWDTRYIKIRFHLKLNDRLADNMVWENWVLDLAEKVFAPYQNVMDLWWTILIWRFVLSLRPDMFALARPLQDCEPLRRDGVRALCVHCAGSLEALFLRRCVFEAPFCLSKQSHHV